MREVEIYTIDDQEYMLLDKITKNNDTYLYFSSITEGNNYIIPLDSEEEVKKAILLLTNKNLDV